MDTIKFIIKKVTNRNVRMRNKLTQPHQNVERYYEKPNMASVFIRF